MSLLIRDATVITVDGNDRILEPGAVYVDGSRIVDVGPSDEVVRRHPGAARVIDGRRKVVIPGFVSTHNHVGYTLFRGRAEDAGLGCVTGMYFPMTTVVTPLCRSSAYVSEPTARRSSRVTIVVMGKYWPVTQLRPASSARPRKSV